VTEGHCKALFSRPY